MIPDTDWSSGYVQYRFPDLYQMQHPTHYWIRTGIRLKPGPDAVLDAKWYLVRVPV